MNVDMHDFPEGSLRCLRYLDKRMFGESQLAKHTLVFTTLLAMSLMVWFLGELFLDIGVSYSLSTIISTLPGAALVGVPQANFLHVFLATSIFDLPLKSRRRRSAYYWGTQLLVYALLVTSVCVASKQSDAMCKAFWPAEKCTGADDLGTFMSPNLYIIFLMTCITMLVVLIAVVYQLCTIKSQDTPHGSDQESYPLEASTEI